MPDEDPKPLVDFPVPLYFGRLLHRATIEMIDAADWKWEIDEGDHIGTHPNISVDITVQPMWPDAVGHRWRVGCDTTDADWLLHRTGEESSFEKAVEAAKASAVGVQFATTLYVMTGCDDAPRAADLFAMARETPPVIVPPVFLSKDLAGALCTKCDVELAARNFYHKDGALLCEECA